MAVVKADAYGHDLKQIVLQFKKEGIKRFAVASLGEGLEVRKLDKSAQVLVLGGTFDWSAETLRLIHKYKFEIAVSSFEGLRFFVKHPNVPIHLKLDTGMNRLGVKPEDWDSVIYLLKKSGRTLEGLMTHFASAVKPSYLRQAMLFEEATRWFCANQLKPRWIHSENSAALFKKNPIKKGILAEVGSLVRPGISLYGYMNQELHIKSSLKPILELVSEVGLVKSLARAEGVSYEHFYKASKGHEYAVVPIGYADGVAKQYRPFLRPEWRTKGDRKKGRLSILGAICMDMIMVKAAKGRIQPKDRVVLWGRFPNSLLAKKIVGPYELNLRIAKRIPRIWVK